MNRTHWMYVSQWNMKVGAPGLTLCAFDAATGEVQVIRQLRDDLSLGCSHVREDQCRLYVVNECDLFPETVMNTGRVYAFAVDPETGALTELSRAETYCPFTSFVATDAAGKYLVTSNHSWPSFVTTVRRDNSGAIVWDRRTNDALVNLFRLEPDGSIGPMLDFAKHSDGDELRLSLLGKPHIPHPHCMVPSPKGDFFACCDKGDGHLYLYAIEGDRLVRKGRFLTDQPGSEPRYCMFHPTRPLIYVNHEHTPGGKLTMSTIFYDKTGKMDMVARTYADLSDFPAPEPQRQQQGLVITPDGRFVYSQAHGYNRILIFSTDEAVLKFLGSVPICGVWPRSLHVSPDGKHLICCCLGGDITVYRIEPNGQLISTGHHCFVKGAGYVSFFAS